MLEKVDELPMELFVSVPQMWKGRSNQIMLQAAREGQKMWYADEDLTALQAGRAAHVERVELVYESRSAAAWAAEELITEGQLNEGDCMVVADIGGGTGDVRIQQFPGPLLKRKN